MIDRPENLSIHFRPMEPRDIPRVHEIDTRSFSLPWSEKSFRFELLENTHSVTWVAEASSIAGAENPAGQAIVVGMIVIWAILDEAHIATLAVDPQYRGFGIGRRLLARALLAAYGRGARMAYLEVRRGNLVAQNLYFRFGFQVVGERPRYYKDNNEDALLMNLDAIDPEVLRKQFGEQPPAV